MRRLLPRNSFGLFLAGLATVACVGTQDLVLGRHGAETTPRGPDLEGWQRMPNSEFEHLALTRLPEGETTALDEFVLAELEGALQTPGPRAVRAAVLLGRAATRAAGEVLLERLERRALAPTRNGDAADVVAAGALERMAKGDWAAGRLAVLGAGPDPHPDLEVRVACAAAALSFRRDEVIPFLLQVLRIGLPQTATETWDFEVSDTTTWARSEAAIALARRANIPDRYPADGPLGERAAIADELEALLGP